MRVLKFLNIRVPEAMSITGFDDIDLAVHLETPLTTGEPSGYPSFATPAELAKGFGFFQSKPASAFSPVAVTPDELGDAWRDGKVHRPLVVHVNGELFGRPDAGTDTTRITTRAVRDGDDYVVTGRKVWTTKALEADRILLLTRTTPLSEVARPTDGMTLFLVDRHAAGVGARAIPKMGRNAIASCETTYDGVRVPLADRVGEEGRGFRYLLDGLNAERILIAAEAVGIGRAALRAAVRYANDRVVFNRPIGQNQGIAFPLAEAHAKLRAAQLMIAEAARRIDAGEVCGEEANLAKYLAAEAGFFAADRAVQTFGGFGYATEYHVERYFRESRLPRLAPISQELVLAYVAEHVLGLPRGY